MVDIGLMRVSMLNGFMYVRMRVEATIWNLLFCMVVCVMTVIMPVSMVVLTDCVNVLMRMFFA
jgi:hypothetical protein